MKVKINGRFYNFFDDITVDFKLDSVASSFVFKGRFQPKNKAHRELFKPLSYQSVEIFTNDDKKLLTGVLVNTDLVSSQVRELQPLIGYSKSGVIEDVTIPFSSYPLERNNVSLSDLTQSLLKDFNIGFVVDSRAVNDMNIVYPKTVAQPSETIKSFLSKLASQRNLIISHNEKGELLFLKPDTNLKPVLFLNDKNTLNMSLRVNGQGLHSKITVIRQPTKDNNSLTPVDTVLNPLVKSERTIVKILSSGSETETKKAADNVLASELSNIEIKVVLDKIIDIKVGQMVEVQNEEIQLYNRAKLIVSSIVLKETKDSEQTTLNLVLPETFTGETPKNIFE